MRSMFSGVSSLRVHQTRMDVIANNIANVNTVGFKASRALFTDAFYQNLQGGTPPDPARGRAGMNPQQVGLGLSMGSIDNLMSQGAAQRTDRALDVMMTGPGFLIVNSPDGMFFTRAGNLDLDRNNNLHINGNQLMGWSTEFINGEHVVMRDQLVPLSLSGDKQTMPAEPTTIVEMIGNLNPRDIVNDRIRLSKTIYDSLGNRFLVDIELQHHPAGTGGLPPTAPGGAEPPHTYWTFRFLGPEPAVDGHVHAWPDGDRTGNPAIIAMHNPAFPSPATGTPPVYAIGSFQTTGTIAFNTRGELIGVATAGGTRVAPTPTQMTPGGAAATPPTWMAGSDVATPGMFNFRIVPVSGIDPRATFGDVGNDADGNPRVSIYANADGSQITIPVGGLTFDMTQLFGRNQVNNSVEILFVDGNQAGELTDISIGGDGTIMGRFTNGRTRVLGQIPVAMFRNPPGLERVGANLWAVTANSGPFSGNGQVGGMQGGALEMSNVDLASEFTEMITTQRGFQAASRTITVSDEMIQELVNLRR